MRRLLQRRHQLRVREAGRGAAVLLLPVADRAAGPETWQAINTADVVTHLLQPALQGGDVGAAQPADLAPFAGEGPVASCDAVRAVADEQRVEVARIVFLEHVEVRRDDEG